MNDSHPSSPQSTSLSVLLLQSVLYLFLDFLNLHDLNYLLQNKYSSFSHSWTEDETQSTKEVSMKVSLQIVIYKELQFYNGSAIKYYITCIYRIFLSVSIL